MEDWKDGRMEGWKIGGWIRAAQHHQKWKNPPVTWKLAATQFAIQFGERFLAPEQ